MNNLISCIKKIKDLDEKGVVIFYANTFDNIDSDGDKSLPGSFSKTLRENGPRIRHLKYHDTRLMPGVPIEIKEDSIGLLVKSQLILNTQLGKETYEEYKAMFAANKQMEHSVRVEPIKFTITGRDTVASEIREISEWKLWEVSTLNCWGANSQALTVSVKNIKEATREELESELIYLKALLNIQTYQDYKLEQIEKQISYLDKLKAALQPDTSTDSRTFEIKQLEKLLNSIKK